MRVQEGILAVVAVACLGGCTLFNREGVAEVHFYVGDLETSEPLAYRVHEFWGFDSKQAFDKRFDGRLKANNIPYGTYQYTLVPRDGKTTPFNTISRKIVVHRPKVLITVSPGIAFLPGGTQVIDDYEVTTIHRLHGRFTSLPTTSGYTWVRLLDGSGRYEQKTPLDNQGNFTFFDVTEGWYLITLMHNRDVVMAEPIHLKWDIIEAEIVIPYRKPESTVWTTPRPAFPPRPPIVIEDGRSRKRK
jgi:hypothetical protein